MIYLIKMAILAAVSWFMLVPLLFFVTHLIGLKIVFAVCGFLAVKTLFDRS